MNRTGSVQRVYVELEAIADGVMQLRGGRSCAVLEASSVNFALQREEEQEAAIAGFAAFLNSLRFPLQILVRVVPAGLDAYLAGLERTATELAPPLAALAQDHVLFLRRLARSRTLLERRYYVIVPATTAAATRAGPMPVRFGRRPVAPDAEAAHRQLEMRCAEVARGFARAGLSIRRLDSGELIQMIAACWSPERTRRLGLGHDIAGYTRIAVRRTPAAAGRS